MILVRRASDDYWFDFTCETDVKKIYNKYKDFIFEKNNFYGQTPEFIVDCWDIPIQHAKDISSCKYVIIIYDSYVE